MQIEAILVVFLILAPCSALAVIGLAIARYAGPNPTVRSVQPLGWAMVAVALLAGVIWLLMFRFLEI